MRSKPFLIQHSIEVYSLDMSAVFFKKKFIFPWMVFAFDRIKDAIDLKSFSFHLLMVTSALIVISGFDEVGHDSEHLIEDRCLSILELLSENLKKDSIFNFFFLCPMSLSFIDGFFKIVDFVKVKWRVINRNEISGFFHICTF